MTESEHKATLRGRLIIEVTAGVIPGKPMDEFTRRWGWSEVDQEMLKHGDKSAKELWIRIHGESREYEASLENPGMVNWVRREWLWL